MPIQEIRVLYVCYFIRYAIYEKERSGIKEENFRYIFMKFTCLVYSLTYWSKQREDCDSFVNIFEFEIIFGFGLIPKQTNLSESSSSSCLVRFIALLVECFP